MVFFTRLIILFMVSLMSLFSHNLFASDAPLYELDVSVFPDKHTLEGMARITVPQGMKASITAGDLIIKTASVNEQAHKFDKDSRMDIDTSHGKATIKIEFTALFEPAEQKENGENSGAAAKNTIDLSGVVLLSNWYPSLVDTALYRLTVEIPSDFEAISEADSRNVSLEGDTKIIQYDFPHPAVGITLIAGKYYLREDMYNDISIKTLFFSDDPDLSTTYIQHSKQYIELYESMIGKFPYKSFSIVENNFQTGYSFPTYTLLGSEVIRLPFIVETSLGHEILHQWFGNYVYVDYEQGNWSEGLTTYLADHWYELLKGKDAEYRKKILIDYSNYVKPEGEIALEEFMLGEDFSLKAIGYGKAAMVFHMLRKKLGDDLFSQALKTFVSSYRYSRATWDNIMESVSSTSNEDLSSFFQQWIKGKGILSFNVENVTVVFREGNYILSFDVIQKGDMYSFELPVIVETSRYQEEFTLAIHKREQHFTTTLSERPVKVVLDRHYDLMRQLENSEEPAVISAFTGQKESIVVVPEKEEEIYKKAAAFFKDKGYSVKEERETTNQDIKETTLLVMSAHNKIYRRLLADRQIPEGGFVVRVDKNPFNREKAVVLFHAENAEEINRAYQKIFRYGNYSFLFFENGRVVEKQISSSHNGIVADLRPTLEAVETKNTLDLEGLIQRIQDNRVIFVGELHNVYSHHVMQYEIIKRLYTLKGRLIIGMEMFQQPFQEYLDQYIQDEISEEEFLKKTEYFKRWKFEYNLYRDILHLARANSVPVIALNLKKELIDKVSKEGIDALTEEEYEQIPQDMDMTNQQYRKDLKNVFLQHSRSPQKDFENFFQSQILWDETMAHTIVKALEEHPDSQMVVLVGSGHLRYSWGIPDRVKRLSGESTAVIINSTGEEISREIADFVLFPASLKTPESPRLGVMLKEEDSGIVIEKLIKGSPSEKAGLKEGDVIKTIEGQDIQDIPDIKIVLLNKKSGDTIKVTIQRRRFLLGTKEIVFEVVL